MTIPINRLKWYGIEPIEAKEAKDLVGDDEIYEEECDCNFDQGSQFQCICGWNENITLDEHKAFQDMRVVSKAGVHGRPSHTLQSNFRVTFFFYLLVDCCTAVLWWYLSKA